MAARQTCPALAFYMHTYITVMMMMMMMMMMMFMTISARD